MKRTWRCIAAVTASCGLIAAACGGDDDDDEGGDDDGGTGRHRSRYRGPGRDGGARGHGRPGRDRAPADTEAPDGTEASG